MNDEQLRRYYRDRLERLYWVKRGMFQDLEDEKQEEYPKEVLSYPEQVWSGKQWDSVQQLQSEVRGWRKKHAKMMLALDKLTPKNSGKSQDPF